MRERWILLGIAFVAVAVPLVVWWVLTQQAHQTTSAFLWIPKVNAFINSGVTLLLIVAFIAIKRRRIQWHRYCMTAALILSLLFLVLYLIYHSQVGDTPYGGKGFWRYVYYFILTTHILFSAVALPMVLYSYYLGFSGRYDRHRRWVRWTYPLWLYVAITGVLIYIFLSPYYAV